MAKTDRDISIAAANAAAASADAYARFVEQAKVIVARAAAAADEVIEAGEASAVANAGSGAALRAAEFELLVHRVRAAAGDLGPGPDDLGAAPGDNEVEGLPFEQAVRRLSSEIVRLLGDTPIDDTTIDRAARVVTAEQSWRHGLGVVLSELDTAMLLGVTVDRLAAMQDAGEVISLVDRRGLRTYPAYQFQDGSPSACLVRAHRVLVEKGHLSEWSAASWDRSPHPELENCSPAQWSAEGGDNDRLLVVAGRDASRLEH